MMFERYLSVPLEDLRFLELYCNRCENGVLVDMTVATVDNTAINLPDKCPQCALEKSGFSTDLNEKIKEFRVARKALVEAMAGFKKRKPQFRIEDRSDA